MAENNPDLSFIFSLGNRYHKSGNFNTGDPPSSKNILSVGSISDLYIDDEIFNFSSANNPEINLLASQDFNSLTNPWLFGSISTEPSKTDFLVVDVDKGDQCRSLY